MTTREQDIFIDALAENFDSIRVLVLRDGDESPVIAFPRGPLGVVRSFADKYCALLVPVDPFDPDDEPRPATTQEIYEARDRCRARGVVA